MSIKFLENKKSYTLPISLDSPYQFESEHLKMSVDMKTGRIQAKYLSDSIRELEIESNLAIVFAISIMHVILQPKPAPFLPTIQQQQLPAQPSPTKNDTSHINPYYSSKPPDPAKQSQKVEGYRGYRPIKVISIDSYVMLRCIGFKELICLPSTYDLFCEFLHKSCDKSNVWFADFYRLTSGNVKLEPEEKDNIEWANTGCGGCGGDGVAGAGGRGDENESGSNSISRSGPLKNLNRGGAVGLLANYNNKGGGLQNNNSSEIVSGWCGTTMSQQGMRGRGRGIGGMGGGMGVGLAGRKQIGMRLEVSPRGGGKCVGMCTSSDDGGLIALVNSDGSGGSSGDSYVVAGYETDALGGGFQDASDTGACCSGISDDVGGGRGEGGGDCGGTSGCCSGGGGVSSDN